MTSKGPRGQKTEPKVQQVQLEKWSMKGPWGREQVLGHCRTPQAHVLHRWTVVHVEDHPGEEGWGNHSHRSRRAGMLCPEGVLRGVVQQKERMRWGEGQGGDLSPRRLQVTEKP